VEPAALDASGPQQRASKGAGDGKYQPGVTDTQQPDTFGPLFGRAPDFEGVLNRAIALENNPIGIRCRDGFGRQHEGASVPPHAVGADSKRIRRAGLNVRGQQISGSHAGTDAKPLVKQRASEFGAISR